MRDFRHEFPIRTRGNAARCIFVGLAALFSTMAHVRADDVLPILLRHCASCHGSTEPEAGLDVRTRESLLRGGKSGPAIVPGAPDASPIIARIRAAEMPPRTRLVEACVKPVESTDLDRLVAWIAAGAPDESQDPDVATTVPDPLVSDADREFWSFRLPRPTTAPDGPDGARASDSIDRYLLEKLCAHGLSFSDEADRHVLIRRATFDLTGLPPSPEEISAFIDDPDPLAWEKLIDRLLASPRYGERWAKFWLDAAGYADSEGKREQDLFRPHAYRYRDWVIRSLNADKPYDRFLLEQIAGDELVDYESAPEITDEIYDQLVATGFLRMVPDATWANITGFLDDRIEVIAGEIDVLGSAVLGLTIKCARCHDHKLDPIPQRDYYRVADVFKGALDEHDWLKPEIKPGIGPVSTDRRVPRHLPWVTSAERRAWEEHERGIDREIDALKASVGSMDTAQRVRALEASRRPEPRVQALWDRGDPSPTHILVRGDPRRPARRVGPGVPSVLTDGRTPFEVTPPWPGAKKTGRRLAFARWLIDPEHPLVARVIVNRVWNHHFGRGIVTTLDDFGRAGARPTHPELLDALAVELVRDGFSLKGLHRRIMTSAAYRQSSLVSEESERIDPDGALLSRMPLRRLDAEQIHDALLAVSESLDETAFGPSVRFETRSDGLVTTVASGVNSHGRCWRRAIYARQERKFRPTILEDFDLPTLNPSCTTRRDSTTSNQALHLSNNSWILELASKFAARVDRVAGKDDDLSVETAWIYAFGRPPSPTERVAATEALEQLRAEWLAHSSSGDPSDELAARAALSTWCHVLFNSAAFIYID
jgi:hypothetical protein